MGGCLCAAAIEKQYKKLKTPLFCIELSLQFQLVILGRIPSRVMAGAVPYWTEALRLSLHTQYKVAWPHNGVIQCLRVTALQHFFHGCHIFDHSIKKQGL